jgi:hypothetical protein
MTDIKYIEDGGKFLLDTGLLFEINRQILHPFGLALQVELKDDTGEITIGNKLWDYRDDHEGLLYDRVTFEQGLSKFESFMQSCGLDKLEEREKMLGYIVQN